MSPTLTWRNLTETDKDVIKDFLEARDGHEAFLYTVPGESLARTWTCMDWTITPVQKGYFDVVARFVEEFDVQ